MNYDDFKVNIKSNVLQLIEVFTLVLGEEYRELITRNLNNLLLINFILPSHLESYLKRNNADVKISKDLLRDSEVYQLIKTKYYREAIKELLKLSPKNSIFIEEANKSNDDSNYQSPLFNPLLSNCDNAITKWTILEKLGYLINVKKPYILYKENNDRIVNNFWDNIFNNYETQKLAELGLRYSNLIYYEKILNTGTIKSDEDFFLHQELLIGKAFSCEEIVECSNARFAAPDISLKSNELVPILVFCPLFDVNEYTLLSFIHELTHAISMNMLDNKDRIKLKLGLSILEFSRGVNIYNDEECKKDNAKYDESVYSLNEAITQYIASVVTQTIIDNNLCNSLFNFNMPLQKVDFEASYPNLMISFKDFIEINFDEIKKNYMGKSLSVTIGNMNFEQLAKLATNVKNNSSIVDETKQILSQSKTL